MSQRLCIALIHPSQFLISLLDSIGVWYENIDFSKDLSKEYSLIIIELGDFDRVESQKIESFIKTGGAVLEISTIPKFYSSKTKTNYSRSIFNSKSGTEFDRISHVDIYCNWASSNSNILSGLVDFNSDKNRLTGFIGMDLEDLPCDEEFIRKKFLSSSGSQPDEIVNQVSRDSLSDVIELSVQRMFHLQKLPFVKKWTSPKTKPVFGFRIDSDYGTKESLSEIYSLLNKHSLKGTWFLHTQAHENWLEWFKELDNQEMALHAYNHGYSSSYAKIRENIAKGLQFMESIKVNPSGFCAPYGIWNEGLRKALEDFNFKYSSEFTSGYDSLPFKNENSENIQIPIHPICTGSLNRRKYDLQEMQSYFLNVYEKKKKLFKPILFYHHPLQSGLEVFDEVFKKAVSDELANLTFFEYASFWMKRHQLKFKVNYTEDYLKIDTSDPSFMLYISHSPEKFSLISSESQKISNSLDHTFKYEPPSLPSFNELENLHSDRLRMLKTSIIDWRNRHKL